MFTYLSILALISSSLLAHKAHVHGDAKLSFLSEGTALRVEFEAPGQVVYVKESLGEVERKKALDDFQKSFVTAFVWPEGCTVKGEATIQDVASKSSRKEKKHHHHHDHKKDDKKDDKKEAKHDHDDVHRDVIATLGLECKENPSGKKVIVNLHSQLKELKNLRISVPANKSAKPLRAKKDGLSVTL
jgi:hypothetical protein